MTKFIVLSGRKQAGKTTAADFIATSLRDARNIVEITSFASPIKRFCIDVVGLTHEQVYGTDEQKNSLTHIKWVNMPHEIRHRYDFPNTRQAGSGPYNDTTRTFLTAREVMQLFGTDIMRNFFDYDIWATAPFAKYKSSTLDYVIIDDCRFPNEADMALKYNALFIRLERNVLGEDIHVSEKALDDYNQDNYSYVIDNNEYKTVEDLHMTLEYVLGNEGLI